MYPFTFKICGKSLALSPTMYVVHVRATCTCTRVRVQQLLPAQHLPSAAAAGADAVRGHSDERDPSRPSEHARVGGCERRHHLVGHVHPERDRHCRREPAAGVLPRVHLVVNLMLTSCCSNVLAQITMINGSNITGIVFFSLFFGVILGRVGERARALKEVIDGLSEVFLPVASLLAPGLPLPSL